MPTYSVNTFDLSLENAREQASVLAHLLTALLLESKENNINTAPILTDSEFLDYAITLKSEDFVPNKRIQLRLAKKNDKGEFVNVSDEKLNVADSVIFCKYCRKLSSYNPLEDNTNDSKTPVQEV